MMTPSTVTDPTSSPTTGDTSVPQLRHGWLVANFPADNAVGIRQFSIALLLYIALWSICAKALSSGVSVFYTLPLQALAAGVLVRLFMIQHDCGHGSFFVQSWLNNLIGRSISVLTLTPYDQWRSGHAFHHANNGNLEKRGVGDIHLLTVAEYRALTRWRRIAYRFYRNPWVFFGFGPIYLFVVKHRFPVQGPDGKRRVLSVMTTNVAIVALFLMLGGLVGTDALLMTQLPITYLASVFGVWIFYVQHQFDGVYYARRPDWSFKDGAICGSSLYILPPLLNWFTADIGIHHLHHLCSKIPSYRLRACLQCFPKLADFNRLGLVESFSTIWLVLWDEQQQRLIRFSELDAIKRQAQAAHGGLR